MIGNIGVIFSKFSILFLRYSTTFLTLSDLLFTGCAALVAVDTPQPICLRASVAMADSDSGLPTASTEVSSERNFAGSVDTTG